MNKDYLDAYVVQLLQKKLYNRKSLRKHIDALNRYIVTYNDQFDTTYASLQQELDGLNQGLANITAAIEQGILTDSLLERAEHLEERRAKLAAELGNLRPLHPVRLEDYIPLVEQFRSLPHDSREFKELVQIGIDKIVTYPYHLEVTLDTGFGIDSTAKETITIRRGDLYALFQTNRKEKKRE